jgi:hypothetical protein
VCLGEDEDDDEERDSYGDEVGTRCFPIHRMTSYICIMEHTHGCSKDAVSEHGLQGKWSQANPPPIASVVQVNFNRFMPAWEQVADPVGEREGGPKAGGIAMPERNILISKDLARSVKLSPDEEKMQLIGELSGLDRTRAGPCLGVVMLMHGCIDL